jgi:hypothetical protein
LRDVHGYLFTGAHERRPGGDGAAYEAEFARGIARWRGCVDSEKEYQCGQEYGYFSQFGPPLFNPAYFNMSQPFLLVFVVFTLKNPK